MKSTLFHQETGRKPSRQVCHHEKCVGAAGEMAESLKYWLYKHENLGLFPEPTCIYL